MARMVKVNLDLPDHLYEYVKTQAKKNNTSISGYMREFIIKKVVLKGHHD